MYSVAYLLESYMPGVNLSSSILNWLIGTNFSTIDYNQTWGGRLAQDVQHYATCRDVYLAWDEENCDGNI